MRQGRSESDLVSPGFARQIPPFDALLYVGGQFSARIAIDQVVFDGIEPLEKVRVHDAPFVEGICLDRGQFPQEVAHQHFVRRCVNRSHHINKMQCGKVFQAAWTQPRTQASSFDRRRLALMVNALTLMLRRSANALRPSILARPSPE